MKNNKRHIEICFTPAQYNLYKRENNLVVVIDIFRATTAVATALYHGAESVAPVPSVEQIKTYRDKGYLTAGERDGIKVEAFEFGNSPEEFTTSVIKGRKLAMSTTNGTKAFDAAKNEPMVAMALVNFGATVEYLLSLDNDVLLLCSGWKLKMNIEDTLTAGKLANRLLETGSFYSSGDSLAIANALLSKASDNWLPFILRSSPRLNGKYELLKNDMAYALQQDICPVVCKYENSEIIKQP